MELENGVVASAAASNYGCGWEEPCCERCGADLTYRTQYRDIAERMVCKNCFMEDFGDNEE